MRAQPLAGRLTDTTSVVTPAELYTMRSAPLTVGSPTLPAAGGTMCAAAPLVLLLKLTDRLVAEVSLRVRAFVGTRTGDAPGKLVGSAGSVPASRSSPSRKPSSSRSMPARLPDPGGTQVYVMAWPSVP